MFLVHRGTSLKKSYGTNTEQKEEELLKSVPLLLYFNKKCSLFSRHLLILFLE